MTTFDPTTLAAMSTDKDTIQADVAANASASTIQADVVAYYQLQESVRGYATVAAAVAGNRRTGQQ